MKLQKSNLSITLILECSYFKSYSFWLLCLMFVVVFLSVSLENDVQCSAFKWVMTSYLYFPYGLSFILLILYNPAVDAVEINLCDLLKVVCLSVWIPSFSLTQGLVITTKYSAHCCLRIINLVCFCYVSSRNTVCCTHSLLGLLGLLSLLHLRHQHYRFFICLSLN